MELSPVAVVARGCPLLLLKDAVEMRERVKAHLRGNVQGGFVGGAEQVAGIVDLPRLKIGVGRYAEIALEEFSHRGGGVLGHVRKLKQSLTDL